MCTVTCIAHNASNQSEEVDGRCRRKISAGYGCGKFCRYSRILVLNHTTTRGQLSPMWSDHDALRSRTDCEWKLPSHMSRMKRKSDHLFIYSRLKARSQASPSGLPHLPFSALPAAFLGQDRTSWNTWHMHLPLLFRWVTPPIGRNRNYGNGEPQRLDPSWILCSGMDSDVRWPSK